MNFDKINIWEPLIGLNESQKNNNTALIILNRPIISSSAKLAKLWTTSSVKFTVDGGGNQLYNWAKQNKQLEKYIPNYICGDMDSVDEEMIEYYTKKGSKTVKLYHQDFNDFTKTLQFATHQCEKITRIYCLVDNGGRLDHVLGNLNTLYDECLTNTEAYLIESESITFLLKKGLNIIYLDADLIERHCGIIPLGDAAQVTTLGFKWNVFKKILKFGYFVSSSNEFDFYDSTKRKEEILKIYNYMPKEINLEKMHVLIETDQQLIFTMSIL
ncbi:unnamed protein product [Brachionus calyciflorus]|uniref:Thiamin pyrophosphokinase thiamin-binding domain-containing protein n=1 Tax=Brachionus calyciflorus TaxID=104777 RepID=A0A813Q1X0_9BILA|nr:unnamed protein product [Brachionus calyciflorus]